MASTTTIPVQEWARGQAPLASARPRGRIVAKDQPRSAVRSLHLLADARIALGFAGGTVASPRGLQLRDGADFRLVREVIGAGHPVAPAPGGRFFLGSGGDEGSCHVVDLNAGSNIDGFPLQAPYLWLDPPREDGTGGRFLAKTPPHAFGTTRSEAHPAWISAHPFLAPLLDRPMQLVVVDRDARSARFLLTKDMVDRGANHLCLSHDGSRLYLATQTEVSAVEVSTGAEIWRQAVGTYGSESFVSIYALALSADGQHLASGGIAAGRQSEQALTILDAATGKFRFAIGMSTIGGTSIRSLAFHPSGWVAAGSSSGMLALVKPDGRRRVFTGAPRGLEALMFVDDGAALLVGGAEKQLRLYGLLDDERDGSF